MGAIWCNVLGTTARVPSQGYPKLSNLLSFDPEVIWYPSQLVDDGITGRLFGVGEPAPCCRGEKTGVKFTGQMVLQVKKHRMFGRDVKCLSRMLYIIYAWCVHNYCCFFHIDLFLQIFYLFHIFLCTHMCWFWSGSPYSKNWRCNLQDSNSVNVWIHWA